MGKCRHPKKSGPEGTMLEDVPLDMRAVSYQLTHPYCLPACKAPITSSLLLRVCACARVCLCACGGAVAVCVAQA